MQCYFSNNFRHAQRDITFFVKYLRVKRESGENRARTLAIDDFIGACINQASLRLNSQHLNS